MLALGVKHSWGGENYLLNPEPWEEHPVYPHGCSSCPQPGIVKHEPLQSQFPFLLRIGKGEAEWSLDGNGSPTLSPGACTVAGVADRSSAGH